MMTITHRYEVRPFSAIARVFRIYEKPALHLMHKHVIPHQPKSTKKNSGRVADSKEDICN